MADHTAIEWTDASWNPVVGCTHVSAGCDHCYAARDASGRLSRLPLYQGLAVDGRFTGEVRLVPERLDQPLRWRKPRRVFVNSMSDLFHDDVPDEFIARVFAVMALTPEHTYQILTKRPGRMASLLGNQDFAKQWQQRLHARSATLPVHVRASIFEGRERPWPLPNVWLGTSVEDQRWADVRIPKLLETPAAVRFLSCEPLLGPIDIEAAFPADYEASRAVPDMPLARYWIDWVIVGGESGPQARPMHPQWARDLRDQCQAAGVPFFMKQMGSAWAKEHAGYRDLKGHDPQWWPEDLRVREYPS